jgi:uncharacterized protein (TIGR02145 family)
MKRSPQFWLVFTAILFFSCTVNAQEENPYAGMPVRDIDGNVYKVIMTETGVWMADNLKTFKYNDGTPIPLNRDRKAWERIKTPAYGWYKDDLNYCETYGAIYNWHAVGTGKLCPTGWHVPTEAEWADLMDYAGTSERSGDNPSKLKEAGTAHWKTPNEGATNGIFFTALPAGEISYFYTDAEPGTRTSWWTSTEDRLDLKPGEPAANALVVGLSYDFNAKSQGTYQKESALPVRCKLDE